nr:MAG TPA: hypothetical protein [Bacteriophage sp.]
MLFTIPIFCITRSERLFGSEVKEFGTDQWMIKLFAFYHTYFLHHAFRTFVWE